MQEKELAIDENMAFFSTFYTGNILDINNKDLIEYVQEVKNSSGKSNSVLGWSSYNIDPNLLDQKSEIIKTLQHMYVICSEIYNVWSISKSPIFNSLKAGIIKNNQASHIINNTRSSFTIIYCAKVGKKNGDIVFYRPDSQNMYFDTEHFSKYTFNKIKKPVRESGFFLFPSYINFSFEENMDDEDFVYIMATFG
jgi:hypothetical protein